MSALKLTFKLTEGLKRTQRTSALTALLLSLMFPSTTHACFWDKDTLAQERRAAPGVLELLSGQHLRRSHVTYELRASRRPQQLKEAGFGWLFEAPTNEVAPPALSEQALAWTDDLAVALDKLKRHDEASALLRRVLQAHPLRYETLANLGTTLVHGGRLQEGLVSLKQALEVNPNAHFGRENIQVALIEYSLERSGARPLSTECVEAFEPLTQDPWLKDLPSAAWGGRLHRAQSGRTKTPAYVEPSGGGSLCLTMPRASRGEPHAIQGACRGFCGYLRAREISREAGLKGVMGMMRFSDHTRPVLLEALGDLLLEQGYRSQNQLASMAYLQASRADTLTPSQRRAYESLAALALVGHRFGLTELSAQLAPSLKRGERQMKRVQSKEAQWAKRGERALERGFARLLKGTPKALR